MSNPLISSLSSTVVPILGVLSASLLGQELRTTEDQRGTLGTTRTGDRRITIKDDIGVYNRARHRHTVKWSIFVISNLNVR